MRIFGERFCVEWNPKRIRETVSSCGQFTWPQGDYDLYFSLKMHARGDIHLESCRDLVHLVKQFLEVLSFIRQEIRSAATGVRQVDHNWTLNYVALGQRQR